jgi:hypothetical protein
LVTEKVGFYEYIKDLDQDFVQKIDLNSRQVCVREFLQKGRNRHGLDDIRKVFDPVRIRQQLLAVVLAEGTGAS